MSTEFTGLHRAIVHDNVDPEGCFRLLVTVPGSTLGNPSWTEACVPPGRHGAPDIGATVWVMFEGNDPGHPVWLGIRPGQPG